jgi:eukaryotic-like serine/threonine-protein kinase
MDSPTLVSQLAEAGLWPHDEPTRARVLELSRRLPEARDLARELIQLELLTPYQANQLLTGKGRSLLVGPYQILERLGEGGMGRVFKVRHLRLCKLVALKVIRPERVTDPVASARFLREIQAAARLAHSNVVLVFDTGEADGVPYYAMQYVPGTDLARLVKQRGPLPVAQACNYVSQAAHGLQHIHESGMVHRDIKPSNLMVTAAPPAADPAASTRSAPDVVKICDLGQARLCEEAEDGPRRPALTQLGVVMGTADYMAPEQAVNSREADIRSDIYGLGCTLYFLLTGRPPYPGGTALEKLMRHQLEDPEPVERLRPDVPPGVAAVLRRMMARQPSERYQTPAEVAAALAPFASPGIPVTVVPQPVPADGEAGPPVLLTPDAIPRRRREHLSPWTWVGVVAGLAGTVLLVLAALRLFRS